MKKLFFNCCYSLFFWTTLLLADQIELIPMTVYEAENDAPSEVLDKSFELAEKADVDLSEQQHQFIAQGYGEGNAFVLFYNLIKAKGCERDYVIQTVKLSKKFYDPKGGVHQEKTEYLVEVMRLNKQQQTKKPDQHLKRYALGNAQRRNLLAVYQVGCATIPELIGGKAWPFQANKNYHRLQDYTQIPGLYNQVKFDFSKQYILELEFDADGNMKIQLPDFLIQKTDSLPQK